MNRKQRRQLKKERQAYARNLLRNFEKSGWGPWESRNVNDWSEYASADASAAKVHPTRFEVNNIYSVQFYRHRTEWGWVTQLTIRRHDQSPDIPWADKQRIKNELMGPEYTAIEVFPSEENLVDQANLFHIWCLPKDFEIPFGLHNPGWAKSGSGRMVAKGGGNAS